MKESPIFSKTYDLIQWLIPVTLKFPRNQRFVMAERVQTCVFQFQEHLVAAAQGRAALSALIDADIALNQLRLYLRHSVDFKLISIGQFQHVGKMVDEIGRLLGGWKKSLDRS